MYHPINKGEIIGVLSTNGNGVYPPSRKPQHLFDPDFVPFLIQDAEFPVPLVLIGEKEGKFVRQHITVKNIDQYRFARDNFTRYCIIAPEGLFKKELLEKEISELSFISQNLMDEMDKC